MMFAKPVALNREVHRDLLFRRTGAFDFAAAMHVAPLCAAEFFVAAKEYAIVFVRTAEKHAFPVIVLGLNQQENSFVAADGQWRGRYLPLALQSYPFAMLESVENGNSQVIIDETYPGFDLTAGMPLFGDGGEPAPELQQKLRQLSAHQQEVTLTRTFVAQLERLELLTERKAEVQLQGDAKFNLNGFLIVDEAKLNALSDADTLALARSGYSALITAHLMSIGNLGLLTSKSPPAGAEQLSKPTTKKRKTEHAKN
jgi:SapC